MIVIDMDMPKYCGGCFYDDCPSRVYEGGKRPKNCPIKCDIEDIKAEIIEKYWNCDICKYNGHFNIRGDINDVLQIIDKYIGKEREE